MLSWLRRRSDVPPIGLHVGPDGVRAIQLEHQSLLTGKDARILAAARLEAAPSDPTFARRLKQLLRDHPFVGRRVILSLPPAMVHYRTFRLETDDAAVARAHARQLLPIAADDPVHLEVRAAGDVRQGHETRREFLATAARQAEVGRLIAQLGPDVVVHSFESTADAIFRAARCDAAVYVGADETLVLLGRDCDLQLIRRVNVTSTDLDRAVARRLGVTPQEARRLRISAASDAIRATIADALRAPLQELAGEAATCLCYHPVSFRAAPPASLRLLGAGATDTHLVAALAASTRLPIDSRSTVMECPGDDGDWSVALGLAMKTAAARPASNSHTAVTLCASC